jgi:hypothetical protein
VKKSVRISLVGLWLLVSSVVLTRLWLTHPDIFPAFHKPLAEYLITLYGAQNAEEVADLEIVLGLCLSLLITSAVTSFAWFLWQRVKR